MKAAKGVHVVPIPNGNELLVLEMYGVCGSTEIVAAAAEPAPTPSSAIETTSRAVSRLAMSRP